MLPCHCSAAYGTASLEQRETLNQQLTLLERVSFTPSTSDPQFRSAQARACVSSWRPMSP